MQQQQKVGKELKYAVNALKKKWPGFNTNKQKIKKKKQKVKMCLFLLFVVCFWAR